MIYVPNLDYECFVVQDSDIIRAYRTKPYNPSYNQSVNIEYRDYYYKSNYFYRDGTQQFSNYTTIPTCLDNSVLTTNYYYRNDFDKICIIFFVFSFMIYFIMKKLVRVFFHGFREA